MQSTRLHSFRGRRVSVALRDGTRIDDCHLVSVGRSSTSTVWLVSAGTDVFFLREELLAVWPIQASPQAA